MLKCNLIQAEVVKGVIEKMQAGEEFEKTTLVEDQAFVAPGIESEYATTMTDEVWLATVLTHQKNQSESVKTAEL